VAPRRVRTSATFVTGKRLKHAAVTARLVSEVRCLARTAPAPPGRRAPWLVASFGAERQFPAGTGRSGQTEKVEAKVLAVRCLAVTDEEAMAAALSEAAAAVEHGDVPVGAVAVAGGRVVGRGHNEREHRGDPTAHAEILALRAAAVTLGTWRLNSVTLYVTLEPCPMCAGALVAARVGRLVFAAADPKAGACGSLYNLCVDPRLNHEVTVVSGVFEEQASRLLTDFFGGRRLLAD
jgi:tRNA(adenine34) deaminase